MTSYALPRPEDAVRHKVSLDYSTDKHQGTLRSQLGMKDISFNPIHKSMFTIGNLSVIDSGEAKRWVGVMLVLVMSLSLLRGVKQVGERASGSTRRGHEMATANQLDPSMSFRAVEGPRSGEIEQVGKLNSQLLPSSTRHVVEGQTRRLIFVGDVHGCYEELIQLLTKAKYDEATDHIITTGDMVNKGPSSADVIDFLIYKKASCVRGNHDDKILAKAALPHIPDDDPAIAKDAELALARSLTNAQLAYLAACPLILQVGQVPLYGNVVVVHGGLIPSIPLVNQNPWTVMNMRTIHPVTHVASKEHEREGYVPWNTVWNQQNIENAASNESLKTQGYAPPHHHLGTIIVYGHDAKRGLQIEKYTKGLDSGCVKGRRLTALILSSNPLGEIVQVKCKQHV